MRRVTPLRRRVLDTDGSADYYQSFLEPELADRYLQEALNDIDWRQECIKMFGKIHLVPRLSAWFSESDCSYTYSKIEHKPQPMPEFILSIKTEIQKVTNRSFNSVLVNLYKDGSHSVGMHSDNEPELGSDVCIASFSLGATRTLRFRHRKERGLRHSLELEHNSLLLMLPPIQDHWLHELAKTTRGVGSRINFSFRLIGVPK